MKKEKVLKHRRIITEVLYISSHGGAQTSKKGKKGYNRKQNKMALRDSYRERNASFYFC